MTIILPVLLLLVSAISFWLLVDSNASWIFKTFTITGFYTFIVLLYFSFATFLGWPALEKDIPEKMTIQWVVIHEPNKVLNDKGRIYFLLDSIKSQYENKFLNLLGYHSERAQPRLFGVPYNRQLHEDLEREVIPRLKDGQAVTGTLKGNGEGKGQGKGHGKGKGGTGKESDESLEQDLRFYDLIPSDIYTK